jgi:hypothetical protein
MNGSDILVAFSDPDRMLGAVAEARAEGYSRLDAYAPFAVEGMSEALALPPTRIRVAMFLGGLAGALCGYGLQYWSAAIDYPINSGGRPLNSWPAFMLVTFELTILFAVIAGFVALLVRSDLTELNKPIFESRLIRRATQDLYILRFSAEDPRFDPEATRRFVEGLSPDAVEVLPP